MDGAIICRCLMHDKDREWTQPTIFSAKGVSGRVALYWGNSILNIEPLLVCLRTDWFELSGGALRPVVVSAYADDFTIFINNKKDVVNNVLQTFYVCTKKAAIAKLKWGQNRGFVGRTVVGATFTSWPTVG